MPYNNLSGDELAYVLSNSLTSSEFELLLRRKTNAVAKRCEEMGHSPSYTSITFTTGGTRDKSEWSLSCGTTYSDLQTSKGDLLEMCVDHAQAMHNMTARNKLHELTYEPKPVAASVDNDPGDVLEAGRPE